MAKMFRSQLLQGLIGVSNHDENRSDTSSSGNNDNTDNNDMTKKTEMETENGYDFITSATTTSAPTIIQTPSNRHPAYRHRAYSGALFTSSKCPRGADIENSCELPFGYIWTPMAAPPTIGTNNDKLDHTSTTVEENDNNTVVCEVDCNGEALEPILCLACLSYCNMYATIDLTNSHWICPICNETNVAPKDSFTTTTATDNSSNAQQQRSGRLSSILSSPIIEYKQHLNSSSTKMTTTNFSSFSTYIFVLDSNLNPNDAQAVGISIQSVLESLVSSSSENSNKSKNIEQYIDIGLVVFDKVISIYQLGLLSSVASCDVYTIDQVNAYADIHNNEEEFFIHKNHVSERSYLTRIKNTNGKINLSNLWRCLSAIYGVSMHPTTNVTAAESATSSKVRESNNAKPLSRLEMLKQRKEARLRKQQQSSSSSTGVDFTNQTNPQESPWVVSRRNIKSMNQFRCTSEAMQVAIDLASAGPKSNNNSSSSNHSSHSSRILLFTNGCPNIGDGSVVSRKRKKNQNEGSDSDDDDDDALFVEASSSENRVNSLSHHHHSSTVDIIDPVKLAASVQYFEEIGKYAYNEKRNSTGSTNDGSGGIAIDVFCIGPTILGLQTYQALADASCGYVLTHNNDVLSSNSNDNHETLIKHLKHNLSFILNHTYISRASTTTTSTSVNRADFSSSSSFGVGSSGLGGIKNNCILDGCIVDLRMSSFISATHLVGCGELLDDDDNSENEEENYYKNNNFNLGGPLPNERSAFAVGASLSAGQGFKTNDKPSKEIIEHTCTRLKMGRYDPLATFSVLLQINDDDEMFGDGEENEEDVVENEKEELDTTMVITAASGKQRHYEEQQKYAFFQCIVRYVDRMGQYLITRVATHRLPIAKNVTDFLDSVDDDVVSVVLGREAVYRSMFGREIAEDTEIVLAPDNEQLEQLAYEAKRDLDATVNKISGTFRIIGLERSFQNLRGYDDDDDEEEAGVGLISSLQRASSTGSVNRAAGSSLDFAFPPELANSLRRLFHLRRGPLLNTGPNQSMDDRANSRATFLRLTLEDCLCLMAPTLWSTGSIVSPSSNNNNVQLEPIPAETLTLWDDCIIAADHYDHLFVWSGKETFGSEYDNIRQYCKNFLLERSKNRFPLPKLHMLYEGDSMSRRLVSRLAPSHTDPAEHQMAHFPALASLSEAKLYELRSKFSRFYGSSVGVNSKDIDADDYGADLSFRSWFWGVASATSASKDVGLSLCE